MWVGKRESLVDDYTGGLVAIYHKVLVNECPFPPALSNTFKSKLSTPFQAVCQSPITATEV